MVKLGFYTCRMHPQVQLEKPGNCPLCGMKLIRTTKVHASVHEDMKSGEASYKPLVVIIGLIVFVSLVLSMKEYASGLFSLSTFMMHFMAGFFLVFSGFKLIDLKGFAEGYSTYDLLAKRWFGYGYIYPFFELILGLLYAVSFVPPLIALLTFLLMTFSGIGVAVKLARHEKFTCACLGTFLKVPLTKVTLIEDFGMAFMAFLMFFIK